MDELKYKELHINLFKYPHVQLNDKEIKFMKYESVTVEFILINEPFYVIFEKNRNRIQFYDKILFYMNSSFNTKRSLVDMFDSIGFVLI